MQISLPVFVPHASDDPAQRVRDCLVYLYRLAVEYKPLIVTDDDEDTYDAHRLNYLKELQELRFHFPVSFVPEVSASSSLPLEVTITGANSLTMIGDVAPLYASLRKERLFILDCVAAGKMTEETRRIYEGNYNQRFINYQRAFEGQIMSAIVAEDGLI